MKKITDTNHQQLSLFDDEAFNEPASPTGGNVPHVDAWQPSVAEPAAKPSSPRKPNRVDESLRQRSKRQRIKVVFADGTEICDVSATETMIQTIVKIGIERVAALGMEICHVPLVSKSVSPRYAQWTKEIQPGWYLMAQSDTKQKYMQLKSIIAQLHVEAQIELGDFESACNAASGKKGKARKKKAQLVVTFPDGTTICNADPLHTYIAVAENIGIDKLRRTNLAIAGKQLFSPVKKYSSQVQLDSGVWMTVPTQIKDKYKMLKVISSMTHIPLDIKIAE